MAYSLVLTPEAVDDIDKAVEYYNNLSPGLGFIFSDILDAYFQKIVDLPTASAIHYDSIRMKAIDTFPYAIHYTIAGNKIIILRVFNTYQQPFW